MRYRARRASSARLAQEVEAAAIADCVTAQISFDESKILAATGTLIAVTSAIARAI